jgi:hypothetical protein
MAEQETIEVKIGQIWKSDDPRSAGSSFRITEVDEAGARARGVKLSVARNVSDGQEGHQTRWIALRRFRPNNRGYRLVENPDTGTAVAS